NRGEQIAREIAGQHQVTMLIARDEGRLGSGAESRREIDSPRSAEKIFLHDAVVSEEQRTCGELQHRLRPFLRECWMGKRDRQQHTNSYARRTARPSVPLSAHHR